MIDETGLLTGGEIFIQIAHERAGNGGERDAATYYLLATCYLTTLLLYHFATLLLCYFAALLLCCFATAYLLLTTHYLLLLPRCRA